MQTLPLPIKLAIIAAYNTVIALLLGFSGSPTLGWSLILLTVYLIPAVIAFQREHVQRIPITVLNIFLGWTFIGWIGALVWAFTE